MIDIKKELGKIEGMGERIKIIARQISTLAGDIEVLASKYDRLNDLTKMKRVEIKFYSINAYDRANLSLDWPGNINDLKDFLKERIHAQIHDKLQEIERLKGEF
jgi:hypothetical protein